MAYYSSNNPLDSQGSVNENQLDSQGSVKENPLDSQGSVLENPLDSQWLITVVIIHLTVRVLL